MALLDRKKGKVDKDTYEHRYQHTDIQTDRWLDGQTNGLIEVIPWAALHRLTWLPNGWIWILSW